LGLLALLSTQSVGGLMAFVAVVLLAIFTFTRTWQKRLQLSASVIASIALLYLLRYALNPVHSEGVVGSDTAIRLLLWATAWNLFTSAPLLGVGWGNFITLYGSYLSSFSDLIPPGVFAIHNIFLQVLTETGVVGFASFFYLIVHSWRQAKAQMRSALDPFERALAFGILGALLTVLVQGAVDFIFQVSQQFGTLFWMLLALLVASGRMARKASRPGAAPALATSR
jgi:O-antigen ligase